MSKHKQGFLRNIRLNANALRLGMNLWPPFIGAGIQVLHIAEDFREVKVRMALRWYNRNYVGTHFASGITSAARRSGPSAPTAGSTSRPSRWMSPTPPARLSPRWKRHFMCVERPRSAKAVKLQHSRTGRQTGHFEGGNAMTQRRQLTALIEREGDGYVALCPELDIASQGGSVEEARTNLVEAIELFLEAADPAEIAARLHDEVFVTRVEVAVG